MPSSDITTMKISIAKSCVRVEWILIAFSVIFLVKLWYDATPNSQWHTNTVISLQEQESKQTKIVSNFLRRNQLVSLLIDAGGISTNGTQTAKAVQNFYKRCFSRPAVQKSGKLSSEHPHFHGYVIENPDLCAGEQRVDLLVYINSALQNRERRQAIRQSWASSSAYALINLKLVFILGEGGGRREQLELLNEHASYGDIVQGKFEDTFRNLTFKAVTFMAWANAHCAQAQYVVKVDDDMFVDMFSVMFSIIPKIADKDYAMACSYSKKGLINRNPKNQWYLESRLLAGQTHYPGFCPGFFSVITGNIIPEVYEASFTVEDFIPIDDVYMTGLSLKNPEKVTIVDIKDNLYPNERSDPDQEIKVNGHFEYIAFRLKSEATHASLWNLRLSKLSALEQKLSLYKDIFSVYEKQPVIIKT